MKKNLLIDIGNSYIKTAIGLPNAAVRNVKSFSYEKEHQHRKLNSIISSFAKLNKSVNEIGNIGVSLLDSKKKLLLKNLLLKHLNLSPLFISKRIILPIKINYSSQLGNDRICSAVAACNKYPNRKKILVIDFGTATTYNLIIDDVFEGGMIAPGIETSLKSLIVNTSLPLVKLESKSKLITNDTKSNIKSGIWFQHFFTIEKIILELKKKHRNLFVISTGGLSKLIYNKTNLINRFEKNLVLEGINFILNQE